jgi:hypothetical protein
MAVLNSWQRIDRVLIGKPFGDGADGDATISSDPNVRATFTGTATQSTGTAGSTAFSNGDLVIIHQSQFTNTGQWEINLITSGGGTTSLTFKKASHYTYGSGAQIIKIPRYKTLTVNSFTITAWNGSTGGLTYLLAKKIQGSGTIDLDGGHANNVSRAVRSGYRGGNYIASTAANAQAWAGEGSQGDSIQQQSTTTPGGGGARRGASSSTSAGGGGGGNGGTGNAGAGEANTIPGAGGSAVGSADLLSMFFGGGGGGRLINSGGPWGQGASGGGALVFNTEDSSDWTGNIYARGGNANTDGGGGGGGGSVLYILGYGSVGSSVLATGGTQPPSGSYRGGGGGVGRIAVHHSGTVTGTTNPAFTDIEDSTLKEALSGNAIFFGTNF